MHSKIDNIEIMINDKADEVIEELFQSFLSRNQIRLEISIRGSDFIFDCVHLLYYKCHKINYKQVGLFIEFLDSIKTIKQQILSIKKMINAFNTL